MVVTAEAEWCGTLTITPEETLCQVPLRVEVRCERGEVGSETEGLVEAGVELR